MILDSTAKSLQILLGAAGVIPWEISALDESSTTHVPVDFDGVTAGAAPVVMLAAPAAGHQILVQSMRVPNNSGGIANVTVRFKNGGSSRDFDFALDDGDLLEYTAPAGFFVTTANGSLKTTTISGTPGTITVEDSTGAPTFPNIDTLQFTGGVVSQPGAGKALFTPSASSGGGTYLSIAKWGF